MLSAERYRTKANELRAEAQKESDPVLRLNCERLAVSYERLADQLSATDKDAGSEAKRPSGDLKTENK